MSNRSSAVFSPRLSQQSNRTDSTVITQIYDPQPGQASPRKGPHHHHPDESHLEPEPSQSWQAQRGWEFLPPKSVTTPTPAPPPPALPSPSAPNFSRPLQASQNPTNPPMTSPSTGATIIDDYFGTHVNQTASSSSHHSGNSGQASSRSSGERKAKYSSRSLYSYTESDASSRPHTETSGGSDALLLIRKHTSQPINTHARRPDVVELPRADPKDKPARPALARVDSIKTATTATSWSGDSSRAASPAAQSSTDVGEPTLDLADLGTPTASNKSIELDEHDAITALPIMPPLSPASFASAAEPPPIIRDKRLLDGSGKADVSIRDGTRQYHTEMSSWPEVRRPKDTRPNLPDRRWSASNYDTSSLSLEKIAKLKKKGINPALWLEMKQAQGKRGRFKLPPLVGNTFLG